MHSNTPDHTAIMQAVCEGLDNLEVPQPAGPKEWTIAIKKTLCTIGQDKCGCKVRTTGVDTADDGEWLYDITWHCTGACDRIATQSAGMQGRSNAATTFATAANACSCGARWPWWRGLDRRGHPQEVPLRGFEIEARPVANTWFCGTPH